VEESNGLSSGKHGYNIVISHAEIAHRQDLNSSILVGSNRIVDHTTFVELHWSRDPFSSGFYRLPPGFHKISHLLTEDFIEVLEDINALHCIRDLRRFSGGDVIQMAHINNHTAWIQSRLVELPNTSPLLECCYLTAYLCSVMLCCKVWCGLVVPVSWLSLYFYQCIQS
jgi:hypothetical protein